MPKLMIEIDLPEGQTIPDPRDVLRLTDPNWLASWWHTNDVKEYYIGNGEYTELTNDECLQVLNLAEKYHDCNVGICWDSLNEWQRQVVDQRENDCQEFLELSGSEEYLDDPAILLNMFNIGEKA